MATSGVWTAPACYATTGALAVQLELWWAIKSQNVSGNYSNVDFELGIRTYNYGQIVSSAAKNWSISTPGGSTSGTTQIGVGSNSYRKITTYNVNIAHNADGTCSFSASASLGFNITFNNWVGTVTVGGSATLNTIPRASTPSINGLRYLGEAVTVYTNRASSSFTHTLTWSCAGQSGTIGTGVGASVAWTPPLSLANYITNATSAALTITCVTYSGGTNIGTKTLSSTLLIPTSMVPSLTSSTITDTMGYFSTYGAYVKGKSKLNVAIVAAGTYGSTINGYSAALGYYLDTYQSSSTVTGLVPYNAGSTTVNIRARDTRGRIISGTRAITVADYQMPTIAASAKRINSSGADDDESNTVRLTISGGVNNVNNAGKNSGTVKIYVKQNGTSSYPSSPFYNQNKGQSFSFTTDTTVSSNSIGFFFKVEVTDSLGETTTVECSIGYAQPLMDFRTGGRGIAIGKVADADGFQVGFTSKFDNDVTFLGNQIGFEGRFTQGNSQWYLLARSTVDHTSGSAWGHIRIWGEIGGWTSSSLGSFEIYVPTRDFSPNKVYVASASPYISEAETEIYAVLDSSNRVCVYMHCQNYAKFRLFFDVEQAEVLCDPITAPWNQPDPDTTFMLSSGSKFLDIYPVGSIVLRYDHTSPASLYGGSWTRISSTFLYATGASGTIGATGGSSTHTLTTSQIPSHNHSLPGHTWNWGNIGGSGTKLAISDTGNVYVSNGTPFTSNGLASIQGVYNISGNAGSGGSHNNNPYFTNISAWRRTA